jgi:hypothetical protein
MGRYPQREAVVTVQTRECLAGDAGEVMRGYYKVAGDVLTMCSEDGRSTGKTCKLQPGDDPRVVATRLLRQEMLRQPRSDFNRPLVFAPRGIV